MSGVLSRFHQFSGILVPLTLLLSSAACNQGRPPGPTCKELEKIAKAYDIQIVVVDQDFQIRNAHGMIEGKKVDRKEKQIYTDLFAEEFSLYPPDLVRRSQLKQVVLCSDLSFGGRLRTAIPDHDHDSLYLDVSRGRNSKRYQQKVIHHEFFHIIDYRDDGMVYQDERRAALNPNTFKYGGGGRSAEGLQTTSLLTTQFPGFLDHYSTTGVEEDKAEVFANLIVEGRIRRGTGQEGSCAQSQGPANERASGRVLPRNERQFLGKGPNSEANGPGTTRAAMTPNSYRYLSGVHDLGPRHE